MSRSSALAIVSVLCIGQAVADDTAKPAPPDAAAIERARPSYERYCVSCHGRDGDGKGPAAAYANPKPRDFTRGIFKWRSTPSGSLPLDEDLFRTIRSGVYSTSMVSWNALSDDETQDLVAYVEHFSPRFWTEAREKAIDIPPETPDAPDSRERGKAIYDQQGCGSCHGPEGKGDGPSSKWPGLSDDWGNPVPPYDLTGEHLKSGNRAPDVYRLIVTGLDGSAMPSFSNSLTTPQQVWDLVHFVRSLAKKQR